MVIRQRFVDDGGAAAVASAVHISGPHANFVSRGMASFDQGLLGEYSEETGLISWLPSVLQNNVLDTSSVELVMQDAALRYFRSQAEPFLIPAASRNVVAAAPALQASNFSFQNFGASPRYSAFFERDVRVGDLVRLTAAIDGETRTFWSSVARLLPRYVPGEIMPTSMPGTNNAAASLTETISIVSTDMLGAEISTAQVAGWSESLLEKGTAEATYIVQTVIGGDAASARFRITASNGDSVSSASLTPNGTDYELPFGTLSGVNIVFSETTPGDLTFVAGTTITLRAVARYTPITMMAGGDYTAAATERAPRETTYIVTVTQGGFVSDIPPANEIERHARPVLSVTTNTGADRAPLVRVEQADIAIPVGRFGVHLTVPEGYLVEGDKFYITAKSSYSDTVPFLGLRDNIPSNWMSSSDTPVTLELFISRSEVVVPASVMSSGGTVGNWSITNRAIQIRPHLSLYDSSWTVGGEQVPLPVISRSRLRTYLTFRYFVSDLVDGLTLVTSLAELEELVSGPVDPSNPLKYAAYHALAGGEGSQVLLTAVADPTDIAEWERVTDLISERDDVFHVFPLCYGDKQVTDLFYRHVQAMNQDGVAKERLLYLLDYTPELMPLAQGSEDVPYEGAFSVETEMSGMEYIAFTSRAASMDFLALNLRAGDIIRTNFVYDLAGELTWTDYTIADILNSSTVRLVGDSTAWEGDETTMVFEVWRHQTPREQREVIAGTAGIQDMLVRYILVDNADPSVDPLGPASTLVGLIGSVVPHQGVSWYPLAGWSSDHWQGKYSNADLNHMAGNGVLIITRHADGFVAARHAVTTAKAPLAGQPETALTLKMSEEMYIRNALLIKKEFRSALRGFVGVSNLVPGTVTAIKANLIATANHLMSDIDYPTLGGRITSDIQNLNIRRHRLFRDTLVVTFKVECPFALNALDCTFDV
jgi:hypothetical protein